MVRPTRIRSGSSGRPIVSFMIPVLNRPQQTRRCIESLAKTEGLEFEILVVDNGSEPLTKQILDTLEHRIPQLHVFHAEKNLGYTDGQNFLATKARGDYLCLCSNDITLSNDGVYQMVLAFRDPTVGQVGPPQCFGYFNETGHGGPKDAVPPHLRRKVENPEYIDGCCYVVKREILVEGRLFPPEFEFMYCEDADLSLRIRASGKKLKILPLKFTRNESEKTSTSMNVQFYVDKNNMVLRRRWGNYLEQRMNPPEFGAGATAIPSAPIGPDVSASPTVHLVRSGARGDVLMITPVARAIKKLSPETRIEIWTRAPDLIRSQYVDKVVTPEHWPPNLAPHRDKGHKVFDLDLAYERRPTIHAAKAYAAQVGVTVEDTRPDITVTGEEIMRARQMVNFKDIVLFDYGSSWENRQYPLAHYDRVVRHVHSKGLLPVAIGLGRQVPEGLLHLKHESMLALVPLFTFAKAFIGHDGAWMHVAQAFGTPSVLLFSVVKPETRVTVGDKVRALIRTDLPCIGCLQKRPAPRQFTPCDRGEFMAVNVGKDECMNIPPSSVIHALESIL